jgi:FkbH-like protein
MKFAEALKLTQSRRPSDAPCLAVALACGCTAHHLRVFLDAHLRTLLPDREVTVQTGLFGDVLGNLERFADAPTDGLAVVLEWQDLDPRLGIRHCGDWSLEALSDIQDTVERQAARLEKALTAAAANAPVALCLPTLPLPPLAIPPGWLLSEFEAHVRSRLYSLAAQVSRHPRIRIVHPQRLDGTSPPGDRLDVRSEWLSGFPYRMPHASKVAELLARLLVPPAVKKGLITDLDDTLWRGLVGEVGAEAVSWSLDGHSHGHALYQQMLHSLSESGVLLAVASRNDPGTVEAAMRRPDLLVRRDRLFPVEAHWGPKSESVGRILRAWNVGAESVVFVDDSPLELAEVQAAHPEIEAVPFPKDQDQAVYDLVARLRDLFGKPAVREEDRLRLATLRSAAEAAQAASGREADRDDLLRGLGAEIVVARDREPPDPRALELVNKTNQFNLNGRRWTEGEWQAYSREPGAFVYVVAYKDRFGPLGKVAVLCGRHEADALHVAAFVLSCRAFSRRIEHQCLRLLFDEFAALSIVLDFRATARNGPMREFLAELLPGPPDGEVALSKAQFLDKCPPLYHHVRVAAHG